jgi:uncharacterized membrane protein
VSEPDKKNVPHCQICGSTKRSELWRAATIRSGISEIIKAANPDWDEHGWICFNDLHDYQTQYVQSLLEAEKGELTDLDIEVIEGLRRHEILTRNPEVDTTTSTTFGARMADRIAAFGGSWTFIIIFSIVLLSWMFVNSYVLIARPFDPFPYILLNLFLSALAAIQAPVIMMSQNRQESRDRQRAVYDYKINLKAELEIRQLHQKMDHLLSHQWERLVEIQEIQMELINELRKRP